MKKIFFILAAWLLVSMIGYTQKITPDKVPALVKQSFSKQFPSASAIKYEMEKQDYEINFKENGIEKSANFDAKGKWLETEIEVQESALPKEVKASVSKNFPGFKLSEVAKVETPEKGLLYEMDVKKDKEAFEVQFSPKGELINKVPLQKEK